MEATFESKQKKTSGLEALLYKEDLPEAAARLSEWWGGGDIGRPALLLRCPRERRLEALPELPKPEGWITDYAIWDFAYRVNIALRGVASQEHLAEAVPAVAPHLAPNCLALFLGCEGLEAPRTVYCEPFLDRPELFDEVSLSESNVYWDFSLRLGREFKRLGEGKFLVEFPDLIEGLDTLAAMRGTQELLIDLLDRPDWVKSCLDRITGFYFQVYERLHSEYKDASGGSVYWLWGPGRVAKLQCDFSAMISKEMYAEFMLPVLKEMSRRIDRCLYHWDGPGALQHLDCLLAAEGVKTIQWTPGDGHEPAWDKRWFPAFHRIFESGRRVYIGLPPDEGALLALKREFGRDFKSFLLGINAPSKAAALRLMEASFL